jgi:hypothetical protein
MSENYVSAQKGSIGVDGDYIIVKNGNRILHKCPRNQWSSLVHACKAGNRVIKQKDLCDMFNIKIDRDYVTSGVIKRIIRQVII